MATPDSAARAASRPGDRRRIDRRATPRDDRDSGSWIGDIDPHEEDEAWPEVDESRFAPDWGSGEKAAADSQFLQRRARGLAQPRMTAFQRIYRVFLGARAAIGIILIVMLGLTGLFGILPNEVTTTVSIFYAAWALSMWLLPRFGRVDSPKSLARVQNPRWLASIGIDILCFMILHMISPGSGFNYAALLVLPVLMAGVLTPRMMALATSAAVTLLLLFFAWINVSGGEVANLLTQAGLAGSGLFVITVLAGELAGRLAREEIAARGSLELARQQEQLNRLVIEEMQDGVLVVDRRARVRAANPAARRLLAVQGMSRPAPFELQGMEAWHELVSAVERAFDEGTWPEAGRDVVLIFDPSLSRTVRVRVRFAKRGELQSIEDYCVLLLEDLRNMQARVRQEKLAAMGRVSAGIAHEIRNPLAAISQANSLLDEDATTPGQRQLTSMIGENVERLKRIVDDVMEVAPGRTQVAGVVDLTALTTAIYKEWALAADLKPGPRSALRADLPVEPLGAVFDPDHLRRVVINLLDNALRHASGEPASVVLRLFAPDGHRAILSVASDGDPIAPDVERFLFEPFFSTRSRGTGLGLYICRELCERYGAVIEYRARPIAEANRNDFSVMMKRAVLSEGSADVDQLALMR